MFISVLAVLSAINCSLRYVRLAGYMTSHPVADSAMLQVLALKVLEDLPELLPISLLLATLLGLKRLCDDNEMVVLFASGLHIIQITIGLLCLALGLAALNLMLSLFVAPKLSYWQETLAQHSKSNIEIAQLVAGKFIELDHGQYVVYFESTSKSPTGQQQLQRPFIVKRYLGSERLHIAATASQGRSDNAGERTLVLENGRIYSGTPGAANYTVITAARYELVIPKPATVTNINTEMLPLGVLLGSDKRRYQAELQRRLSAGVSVVVLLLLAIPMGIASSHHSRLIQRIAIALSVYFIYSNSISIACNLIERGELPVVIGVWPIHLSMALIALLAIWLQINGYQHLRRWQATRPAIASRH